MKTSVNLLVLVIFVAVLVGGYLEISSVGKTEVTGSSQKI